MKTIEIKIPSDPKFSRIVRNSVSHICNVIDFSNEQCRTITLAVDEAVSNIIQHAYQGDTDKSIIIAFKIQRDCLEIVLRDFGAKAELDNIKSRELEDVQPGGLGVHFIKSIMDEVIYDNTLEEGNQLILRKYRTERKNSNVED
ncbi:MAG: hypothetical protein GWN44_11380 [Calditrichae bacterium]|nr:hypothetical protein [Calditrichia bacterium]